MAEIRMPKMGDGMEEGTILRWLKREGDSIAVADAIAEVETDKANVEIPAEEAGTLSKIVAKEGDTVPVGAVIQGDGHNVVFVEKAPGHFQRTEITVGKRSGDVLPVLSGLKAGDRVVVDGAMLLKTQ